MSRSMRGLLVSTVTLSGVAGGIAIGSARSPVPASSAPAVPVSSTSADGLTQLNAQVRYLLAEERALRIGLSEARARLAAAQRRAAPTVTVAGRGAASARPTLGSPGAASSVAPSAKPTTHATTGASGTGSTSSTEDTGEHDD